MLIFSKTRQSDIYINYTSFAIKIDTPNMQHIAIPFVMETGFRSSLLSSPLVFVYSLLTYHTNEVETPGFLVLNTVGIVLLVCDSMKRL